MGQSAKLGSPRTVPLKPCGHEHLQLARSSADIYVCNQWSTAMQCGCTVACNMMT